MQEQRAHEEEPAGLAPRPCIGVFDSGLGGLTVLRALRQRLPQAGLLYVADTAHAPYGEKSPEYIAERSLRIGGHLRALGAKLIVVACNTATAHAIETMRRRWPTLAIVGIEPGIKPAVAASGNGRVGVLATQATIASPRYQALVERYRERALIYSQPCPGLVDLIELGDLESPALLELIERLCGPLREAGVDTVLMGCTHYPLVQAQLQAALGAKVQLLNIEDAVAQQAERLWARTDERAMLGELRLQTSGDATALTRFVHQVFGWADVRAEALPPLDPSDA
ncbi:MAG: glutamate racemase [Paucibacter sp.]|nr:glutamate racemase [Roseateles sp.]